MITRESIMDVLRTIPDPEMPISIVDLGLVEHVRVQSGERSEEQKLIFGAIRASQAQSPQP
jgi:metal-sulfur cluster biosynthetic enzyme